MLKTHAYEREGEVLFRRSGNRSRYIQHCTIIRTRARVAQEDGRTIVRPDIIATGTEGLHFPIWFDDWTEQDDQFDDGKSFESGRIIEVAVATESYRQLVRTGRYIPQHLIGEAEETGLPLFSGPVTAIRIDGEWVEPFLSPEAYPVKPALIEGQLEPDTYTFSVTYHVPSGIFRKARFVSSTRQVLTNSPMTQARFVEMNVVLSAYQIGLTEKDKYVPIFTSIEPS